MLMALNESLTEEEEALLISFNRAAVLNFRAHTSELCALLWPQETDVTAA